MGISLVGLNKADVLAALYNASRPQGKGFLRYSPAPMTREQAQEILGSGQTYFDYLDGRVMKVELKGDELNPWGFDRDNGQGAAERAINSIREQGGSNSVDIQAMHKVGKISAAETLTKHLGDKSKLKVRGGTAVMSVGFSDVAEHLKPAIDKALEE